MLKNKFVWLLICFIIFSAIFFIISGNIDDENVKNAESIHGDRVSEEIEQANNQQQDDNKELTELNDFEFDPLLKPTHEKYFIGEVQLEDSHKYLLNYSEKFIYYFWFKQDFESGISVEVYNVDNGESQTVDLDKVSVIYEKYVHDGIVYLVTAGDVLNTKIVTIYGINEEGNATIVFQRDIIYYKSAYFSDDDIIVVCDEINNQKNVVESILWDVKLNSGISEKLISEEYVFLQGDTISGTHINNVVVYEDEIWFEKAYFDSRPKNYPTNVEIVKYSLQDSKVMAEYSTQRKGYSAVLGYLSGNMASYVGYNNGYLILSKHCINRSEDNIASIYSVNKDEIVKEFVIPEVRSTNDIQRGRCSEENIQFLNTGKIFYIFDFENKRYYYEKYEEFENFAFRCRSKVVVKDGEFGYLTCEDGKVFLNICRY